MDGSIANSLYDSPAQPVVSKRSHVSRRRFLSEQLEPGIMRKIRIVLKKDGTQDIEVLGAQGAECLELSRQLEERLGVPDGERRLKPEYHEDPESASSETELGS